MSNNSYSRTAIFLHWLIAAMIVCTFILGVYMTDLKLSPQKLKLYSYHKWIGISILALVLVRLYWRITHKPPAMLAGQPRWQKIAAHATHHTLYLLMIALPITGWLMSSALGFQVVWLGILPLTDLIEKNDEVGKVLGIVHHGLGIAIFALVFLHIVAALKHHWVDRDDTLKRMLPFLYSKDISKL